jgi:ATP-dependent DNA ligase
MRQIHPMGAIALKKEKWNQYLDDPNYVGEKKFDGSRYASQVEVVGTFLTSRRESVQGGMVDKTLNVPHIIKDLRRLPDSTTLDAEVDIPGDVRFFKYVQGVMGSDPERAQRLQTGNPLRIEKDKKGKDIIIEGPYLVYKTFDILDYKGENLRNRPLRERRAILEDVFKKINFTYVEIVQQYEDKRTLLKRELDLGQEGIMLKNLNSIYVEGKEPSQSWYKIKGKETYDGIVKGYKFGTPGTKNEFKLGTLTTFQYKDGELVEVAECGGLEDVERIDFKERLDKGEEFAIEFEAYGLFEETHRYRHPSYKRERTDKNFKDCIYGKS